MVIEPTSHNTRAREGYGVVSTMGGANINRDTVGNVEAAGFAHIKVQDLWRAILKQITAEKGTEL